ECRMICALSTRAVSVSSPVASPSVQVPGDATPSAPVDTTGLATRPPLLGENTTGTPCRGWPSESTSRTDGATGSAARIWPVCASPAATVSAWYVVTLKRAGLGVTQVTALPSSSTTVAITVFGPLLGPRIQLVDTMPFTSAVSVAIETEPPPVATANLTTAPRAGPPWRVVTCARSESATGVDGVAALGGVQLNVLMCAAPCHTTCTPIGCEVTPSEEAVTETTPVSCASRRPLGSNTAIDSALLRQAKGTVTTLPLASLAVAVNVLWPPRSIAKLGVSMLIVAMVGVSIGPVPLSPPQLAMSAVQKAVASRMAGAASGRSRADRGMSESGLRCGTDMTWSRGWVRSVRADSRSTLGIDSRMIIGKSARHEVARRRPQTGAGTIWWVPDTSNDAAS